jgi:hypothetical protein
MCLENKLVRGGIEHIRHSQGLYAVCVRAHTQALTLMRCDDVSLNFCVRKNFVCVCVCVCVCVRLSLSLSLPLSLSVRVSVPSLSIRSVRIHLGYPKP